MSSQDTLSRELALRIGLAARALPDTDAKRLFTVLTHCVGLPITEDKIGSLNLKTLKTAQEGEFSDIDDDLLKKALHILKTDVETGEILKPQIMLITKAICPALCALPVPVMMPSMSMVILDPVVNS